MITVLVGLRAVLPSPTVENYDPLVLSMAGLIVLLVLFYEISQDSQRFKMWGEQMVQVVFPSLVFFLLLYLVINTAVFPARVNGASMAPTYQSGDLVVFWMLTPPQRQDVVFVNITSARTDHFTDEFMLKRIVGVAGDRVTIQDGVLYINNEPLLEPYVSAPMLTQQLPCFAPQDCHTVPPGTVFVLGDNRNASIDSRFYGVVATEDIIGKAVWNVREAWPW
jgi:signal peptidase I